jgi:eukaryotic-like serine/threonine-protein kinase
MAENPHLHDPLLGRMVGRYRIVERIGAGGMGSVYKAIHEEIPELVSAVKVLSERAVADSDLRQRFRDEAAISARLGDRSPYIVQIRDYGILAELNLPYFAMEFLQGRTLDNLLFTATPLDKALTIANQICEGLRVAHAQSVVHRDLKPTNIFLIPDPPAGERVKILDFGIAKLISEAVEAKSNRQATQGYLGTPHYSSPEQLRGEEVTPRSDIYSLGMILYELICGAMPFAMEDQGFYSWLQAHLERSPLPMGSKVPVHIEQTIQRCLAKDPQMRPASVLEVAQALQKGSSSSISRGETIASPQVMLPPQEAENLQKRLALLVGPIAPTLIKKALSNARGVDHLMELLCENLPPEQRETFVQKAFSQPTTVRSFAPSALPEEFIQRCEQELAQRLGPIARLLVQGALKNTAHSQESLIESLATQITDPTKAETFRNQLHKY